MRVWVSALLVLLVPGMCFATVELKLDEALRLAEEHSPGLKGARELVGAAERARAAAVSERYPTASLSAASFYNSETAAMELHLPAPLDMTIARDIGSKEHYQADARLSLPLFTGGRISGGVATAQASLDYYQHRTTAALHALWYQTRILYLTLARAERQTAVAEASLRRAQLVAEDVHSMYEAGTADSLDLLEASTVVIDAEYRRDQAASARRTSEINLVNHLGLPPGSELRLTGIPEGEAGAQLDSPVEPAVRPDWQAAQSYVTMNDKMVRLSSSERFPTLAAYGGYSVGKPNLDFFNADWNDYFTVGLNLSWSFNLGDRSGRRIAEQRHRLAAARHDQETLSESIEREIKTAEEQVDLARQSYASAQRQHATTSATYRLATARHRQGALPTNRLLEIEADLSRAESTEAASLIDVFMAQSLLYYVTGSEKLKEGF